MLSGEAAAPILVVDDDPTTRLILRRMLERIGRPVLLAADGEEGWDVLAAEAPRLVITDWEMPRLSGPDFCRRVRSRRSQAYTYIIMLSARNKKVDLVAGLDAGADDFVSKPFNQAEIRVRLQVAGRLLTLEDELRRRNEQLQQLQQLNAQLSEIAAKDPLMKIGNRRSFEQAIVRLHSLSRRSGRPYSLVMVDVDNFKRFNDRYGHPQGDAALSTLAATLREQSREHDEPFRYGGEEVVILLPLTGEREALAAADRLREDVQAKGIVHEDNPPGVLTVSMGGATFDPASPSNTTWVDVVQRADEALYDAKRRGRNQVVWATPSERRLAVAAG